MALGRHSELEDGKDIPQGSRGSPPQWIFWAFRGLENIKISLPRQTIGFWISHHWQWKNKHNVKKCISCKHEPEDSWVYILIGDKEDVSFVIKNSPLHLCFRLFKYMSHFTTKIIFKSALRTRSGNLPSRKWIGLFCETKVFFKYMRQTIYIVKYNSLFDFTNENHNTPACS